MMEKKTIFFFISEEGFGHIVRACSIINEFTKLSKQNFDIHIFTGSHIPLLEKNLLIEAKIHVLNSGLLLRKNRNCSLDQKFTLYNLIDWKNKIFDWKNQIINSYRKCDLIISDSVPQAGLLSKHYKCKAINISHFTWDWMFEEINLRYIKNEEPINGIQECISQIKILYDYYDFFIFPPLTPKKNINLLDLRLRKYKKCHFILSDSFITSFLSNKSIKVINSSYPNLLLMNNGTSSLTKCINEIIYNWSDKYQVNLLLSPVELESKALNNITKNNTIYKLKTISEAHSAIAYSNHFLARCGYNTLSESIFTDANAILVSEESNPEIESNLGYAAEKNITIIKPGEITNDKIVSIIKNYSKIKNKKYNHHNFDEELLTRGRKQCVEMISTFLI